MFPLLIFSLLAIIIFVLLGWWLRIRLARLRADYELTKASHTTLLNEHEGLRRMNAILSTDVQNLIDFYEITKGLTKYLTLDEVFVFFRERLKKKIGLEDCQFIKPGGGSSGLLDYDLFPLKIDEELIGQLAIKGIKLEDKDKFYILFNQLTLVLKRVRLYAKIEELSITDSLTGVFLRRYFLGRLKEEIDRCSRFNLRLVFLMLDLDNFKSYNDRYGHLVGDCLLSTVAKIIKDNVREIDIVARYGGEEFSIILPDTDKQEAKYVSLRLRQAIEKQHIHAYDEDLQITVSIGASVFPQDTKDIQHLIDQADRAMYQAKQMGKNRVCFWDNGPFSTQKTP